MASEGKLEVIIKKRNENIHKSVHGVVQHP